MSSKTDGSEGRSGKRSNAGGSEGRSAKRPKTAGSGGLGLGSQHSKPNLNFDTFRFDPREEDRGIFSTYVVQYYIQQWGQNLFMEEHDGYIVVRFVDGEAGLSAVQKYQLLNPPPPFKMRPIKSIKLDSIRLISPGTVTMYHPPRDLDHYDDTTSLPRGWNNPFPIKFQPPPAKAKDTTEAQVAKTDSRPPRFKPFYPPSVQPEPPSHEPPFNQPVWPRLPGETVEDEEGA